MKLKFNDFQTTTAECQANEIFPGTYEKLLAEAWERRRKRTVRLIGAGVRFVSIGASEQLELAI